MNKEEFAALMQSINEKASEYARCGKSIQLRQQIWLSLWSARLSFFHAKAIRGYLRFSPSSLYETGEEFLNEVLSQSIPQILDNYALEYAETPDEFPFMKYFNICFIRKVYNAYSNIQESIPHDSITVRSPVALVYQQPQEDALIPNTLLKQGMIRRILGRIQDGDKTWIKIKFKEHGRTVFLRESDVECRDKATVEYWGSVREPEGPDCLDERIVLRQYYEDYTLSLLSLVERFFSTNQREKRKGLTENYCFQLLYTEKLLEKLKSIYEAVGDVQSDREQSLISAAEIDLLDYLLTKVCRSFTSIAVTPLHACRDYKYLNSDSDKEISIPVAGIIYAHFLVDKKGMNRKLESIPPAISGGRKKFNDIYNLVCNMEAING